MIAKSDTIHKTIRTRTIIISMIMMLVTIAISGEILVRYLVRNDTDVQQLNGIAIPPLHPPLQVMQKAINAYKAQISQSSFIYDDTLGWNNQALYESDGVSVNAAAIRSSTDFSLEPSPDILRIALFGDSFTYSAGVTNDETLNHFLEQSLNDLGIRAEVINFGVPAYGADQSYLRWLEEGVNYQPDMVLLSFSTRMSGRSLNIFRVISSPDTSFPFSKPRFYLKDGALQLVNSPTIPLDDIISTFEDFENHPLRDYEYYYDDRYTDKWWYKSRFFAYVSESIRNTIISYIGDDSTEVITINRAIIEAFASNATQNNAVFMLGHLPTQKNLSNSEGNFQYYDLLLSFRDQYPLLDSSGVLSDVNRQNGWLDDGHYNRIGNEIVGQYFAAQIQSCLDNATCMPPRFVNDQRFQTDATES